MMQEKKLVKGGSVGGSELSFIGRLVGESFGSSIGKLVIGSFTGL